MNAPKPDGSQAVVRSSFKQSGIAGLQRTPLALSSDKTVGGDYIVLLKIYALTAVVLTFKMAANSIVQGRGRLSNKVYTNPEDAKMFAATQAPEDAPIVRRAAACWRNDLENIPIFLILAGIYVAAGNLSPSAFELYCVVFVIARILHTVCYLNSIQPWRTVAYTIGAVAIVALTIHVLLGVGLAGSVQTG
jgi:glutathione S-transferase